MNELMKRKRVEDILRCSAPVLISYSGGVDSSTLLAVALRVLGRDRCRAVLIDTPSLPRHSLATAIEQAQNLGVELQIVPSPEFALDEYRANPPHRCYVCKAAWYRTLTAIAEQCGCCSILHGENVDDDPRERPGAQAAQEFGIIAPFREAGMTKREIRAWASEMGLPCADAPASPCLATRIPYGMDITTRLLTQIERAEDILHKRKFRIVRVRIVPESSAESPCGIVQVAPDEVPRLRVQWKEISEAVLAVGFSKVEMDEVGYQGAGLR